MNIKQEFLEHDLIIVSQLPAFNFQLSPFSFPLPPLFNLIPIDKARQIPINISAFNGSFIIPFIIAVIELE